MRDSERLMALSVAAVGLLAGCATPAAPDPSAELSYCHKTNKGRVIACTQAPAPSLKVDAEAKRFTPDPSALTVYVVRSNWLDGRNFVRVQADGGPSVETLPNTMVRWKLKPARHTIAFEFDGGGETTTVEGNAGELRFVRIDGTVLAWKSTYEWAPEPESAIRERARKARLVADIDVR